MAAGGAVTLLAFGAKGVINRLRFPIFNGMANRTLPRKVARRGFVLVAVVTIGQLNVTKRNAQPAVGAMAVGAFAFVMVGFAVAIGTQAKAGVIKLNLRPGIGIVAVDAAAFVMVGFGVAIGAGGHTQMRKRTNRPTGAVVAIGTLCLVVAHRQLILVAA